MASRLFYSIRTSLLVVFGAARSACRSGRRSPSLPLMSQLVEHVLLLIIDVQASLPFLIVALAMLAYFGNSLTRFVLLMGFTAGSKMRGRRRDWRSPPAHTAMPAQRASSAPIRCVCI